MKRLSFLAHFIKDKSIASMTPTAQNAIEKICAGIDFARDQVIVEYGPGEGAFCRYLLERLTPGSKLIAIETNVDFVAYLQKTYQDSRFEVVKASAVNVDMVLTARNIEQVDYIISGIPFSFFSLELKRNIIAKTYSALAENGEFLVYQFSKQVEPYLKEKFAAVHWQLLLRNLPPLFFMQARKRG